ncbi:hypothetical protein RCL_jg17466.t1 [Rhizophagus clarus]|uniref:Restriction of telomere capping protein 4 n=1 Tax=Rhizophagus clarus TaxID=94130 RepID=A0A8H3QED8_9GLOM|nr:hypothetical protein RCL_jg17466.t1 [Rhizophagus clarus]
MLKELPLNDDLNLDLNLDLTPKSHNLCPYCDEILPDILPEKLKDQNISSYYWDIASSIYKEVEYNKAKAPMMFMKPGYYEFNGLYIIVNTLMDLFINFNNLTKEQTYPLNPMDFIYEVLVPKVILRLIREDRNNNITLEDAKKILTNSVEFGVYMHNDEIDIDNSLF